MKQAKLCLSWLHWLDTAEELRSLSLEECTLRPRLKVRFEELCLLEEIKWKQRSRVQWLKAGDANTKFFHIKANRRRSQNFISQLSDGSALLSPQDSIAAHLRSFFTDLLGTEPSSAAPLDLDWLYSHEDLDLSCLHTPFSEEEVRRAVFSSAPDKAPRPDGLSMRFYQHFWTILKDDILGVFNNLHSERANLNRINTSWICLIPKKGEASTARDFRPISLVNSLIKIVSKVLATRLQGILDDLINLFQAAFVKGRSIRDNFYTAHILTHHLHSTKQPTAILKIDFERAFDHLNWNFLLDLLRARGFSSKWISWISELLSSSSTAVLLNDSPGIFFDCKRGLRQGDPISPLLFILEVDVLFRMLHLASFNLLLPPVGVGEVKVHTL